MPARLPIRRLRVAAAALAVCALLAGCATAARPAVTAVQATPVPLRQQVDRLYRTADVVDDRRDATLTIVPKRPNGALVVYLHGWSQDRWSMLARREEASVARAVVDAGYTLLAADAHGKAWGDPASVRAYVRAIAATRTRYRLHDVFLAGESMGGLATMQIARRLPAVRAVVAWYPVCDLSTMREPRFAASIRTAWPHGHAAVSPVPVSAKPMLVWASAADTVVDAGRNAARCVDEARAAGGQVEYFHTSGEHGDPSNFVPPQVVRFFAAHRSPGG